jgi:tRNA pseudouridine55 synthase
VPIVVHRVSVEAVELPLVRFSVTVSTGTYVRGLARDVGRTLGCGAHLTSLRRTGIGPFLVGAARPPEDLAAGHDGGGACLKPAEALVWMRRRVVVAAEAEAIRHGRPVPRGRLTPLEETAGSDSEPIAVMLGDRLVAIATVVDAELRPRKVFD